MKTLVYVLSACVLILLIAFCGALAIGNNSTHVITLPIVTLSTPVVDTAEKMYVVKAYDWTSRLNNDNNTLVRFFKKDATTTELRHALDDIYLLQKEVHAYTNVPALFSVYHTHFSTSLDHYVLALTALAKKDMQTFTKEMNTAQDEMQQAYDILTKINTSGGNL